MSDMSSMNRERKKTELRKQMISSGNGARAAQEEAASGDRKKSGNKGRKWRIILIFAVLIGILAAGGRYYFKGRQYTEYQVVWETALEEGGTVGYKSFGTNVLKYTKDGISYIDNQGKTVWMQSYEMKNPAVCVNGDYAVVADRQGNTMIICDVSGVLGQASTVLPIINAVISQNGVTAAILEDSAASYIQYYNRDGSSIDLSVKAAMAGDGYPVDIALSPDGNQTIASYMYISGGELKNRVVFYDFSEIGKNQKHLVGGFDEEFADVIAAKVIYPDDTHACAFTDRGIRFFSSRNQAAVQLTGQADVDETIETVFYSEKYAGFVVRTSGGENPYRLELYKINGDKVFSAEFNFQYKHVDISDDLVILYNEEACLIYNTAGNLKYYGDLGMEIEKMNQGRSAGSVIVTGTQVMKEIRLK